MKDLALLTSKELVNVHNQLAEKVPGTGLVKRFSDKKSALSRIRSLQREGMTKSKSVKKNNSLHQLPITDEVRIIAKPGSKQKVAKLTSLRGKVLTMLLGKGTTVKETESLLKKFDQEMGRKSDNVENRSRELIHLVHRYLGYGLKEKNGKIYAFTSDGE